MLYEIIGWIGTACILTAYFAVSTGRTKPNSKMYQCMNVVGSMGIIVNSLVHSAIPSVGLNIIWLGIALYGLLNTSKR